MTKDWIKTFIILLGVMAMLFNLFGCSGNHHGKGLDTAGSCGENIT